MNRSSNNGSSSSHSQYSSSEFDTQGETSSNKSSSSTFVDDSDIKKGDYLSPIFTFTPDVKVASNKSVAVSSNSGGNLTRSYKVALMENTVDPVVAVKSTRVKPNKRVSKVRLPKVSAVSNSIKTISKKVSVASTTISSFPASSSCSPKKKVVSRPLSVSATVVKKRYPKPSLFLNIKISNLH